MHVCGKIGRDQSGSSQAQGVIGVNQRIISVTSLTAITLQSGYLQEGETVFIALLHPGGRGGWLVEHQMLCWVHKSSCYPLVLLRGCGPAAFADCGQLARAPARVEKDGLEACLGATHFAAFGHGNPLLGRETPGLQLVRLTARLAAYFVSLGGGRRLLGRSFLFLDRRLLLNANMERVLLPAGPRNLGDADLLPGINLLPLGDLGAHLKRGVERC